MVFANKKPASLANTRRQLSNHGKHLLYSCRQAGGREGGVLPSFNMVSLRGFSSHASCGNTSAPPAGKAAGASAVPVLRQPVGGEPEQAGAHQIKQQAGEDGIAQGFIAEAGVQDV